MRTTIFYEVLSIVACLSGIVSSQKVYCHYLVGVISAADALTDAQDAAEMGIDAFALNVGDATLPWVQDSLHNLFDAALSVQENGKNFNVFISMDVYASGAACYAGGASCNGPYDYADIFSWAFDSPAYELGPSGVPLVSTFSASNFDNTYWLKWRNSMSDVIYFCPDFDSTDGYYNGTEALPGWWYYWGEVVDCIFSWETAWPKRGDPVPDPNPNIGLVGGGYEGDVTMDQIVQAGALGQQPVVRQYMMGLSSLQYKNSYGSNVFRSGGVTLPARMEGILNKMFTLPDFVEIQTWNDGPEGHNMGNLWSEENSDLQPSYYTRDHSAWQPLISSFIAAYKGRKKTADMRVPSYVDNTVGVGAMWYSPLPMDAECPYDDNTEDQTVQYGFWEKPYGYESRSDAVNWALVLEPAYAGSKLELYSGGELLGTWEGLVAGLNYANTVTGARNPGAQYMRVIDPSGSIVLTASGGECAYQSTQCLRAIYDLNFEVLPFIQPTGETDLATCDVIYVGGAAIPGNIDDEFTYTGDISLPAISEEVPFETTSDYTAGMTLQTVSKQDQNFVVDFTLVGSPSSWDIEDFCGTSTDCIGDLAEFLFYQIIQAGGPFQTTLRRDLPSKDNRHFQFHPAWKPASNSTNSTCSTVHCKLVAEAPIDVWVLVGNGTHQGKYHELHFLQTHRSYGYRGATGYLLPENHTTTDHTTTNTTHTLLKRYGSQVGGYKVSPLASDKTIYAHFLSDQRHNLEFDTITAQNGGVDNTIQTMGQGVDDTVRETMFPAFCFGLDVTTSFDPVTGLILLANGQQASELAIDQIEDDLASCAFNTTTPISFVCYPNASLIDTSLQDDPDEELTTTIPTYRRSLPLHDFQLDSRTATSGSGNSYVITDVLNPSGPTIMFQTPSYPNGMNGGETWLSSITQDNTVYSLLNPRNCLDSSLNADTDPTTMRIISEHIIERQSARNFLEFVQQPGMDLGGDSGIQFAPEAPVAFESLEEYANLNYQAWITPAGFPRQNLPLEGSAFSAFANTLGSATNPTVMTNLEQGLNGYKARVWATTKNATALDVWLTFATDPPSVEGTNSALTLLRQSFATFEYTNTPHVNNLMGNVYDQALAVWQEFDTLFSVTGFAGTSNMAGLWTTYMNFLAQRMVNVQIDYVNTRLDELAGPWNTVLNNPAGTEQHIAATGALAKIAAFRALIPTSIQFDRSRFV